MPFATRTLLLAGALATVGAPAVAAQHVVQSSSAESVKPVMVQRLPDATGEALYAVVVSYAPGVASARHHHEGSVFAYVLTGHIRSRNSATGPMRVYGPGESFYEPAGSEHLVSENASTRESASMLAVFIAPRKAVLTTVDR
jgi:quercetin dioxygenase-like cupin family protein